MTATVADPTIDEGALRATLVTGERPSHPTALQASAAFTWSTSCRRAARRTSSRSACRCCSN